MADYPPLRKYPKYINVNNNRWKIEFKRTLSFAGTDNAGECHVEIKTIKIKIKHDDNEKVNRKERYKTFFHELLHAFEVEYGFEMIHRHIDFLEKALAEYMMNNKVRCFKGEVNE